MARRKRKTGAGGATMDVAATPDRLVKARVALSEALRAAGYGIGAGPGGVPVITNLSQFDAANTSARRGWVYAPTLDTRKDLDRYSLEEMWKKSRWLQDNVGLAGRLVDGLADFIGYLVPEAATDDEEWNREADTYFLDRVLEAGVFDRAGKLDWMTWQTFASRSWLGDGDSLTALTETRSRHGAIAFYEAHQIHSGYRKDYTARNNPVDSSTEELMGVIVSRQTGRRLGFRIQDDPSRPEPDGGRVIDAQDAIFISNDLRHNRVRGVTALHRAINHVLDITEINAATKGAIKVAADVVYQIVSATDGNRFPAHPLQGAARIVEVEADGTVVAEGEGTDTAQKVRLEDLLGNPVAMQMPGNQRIDMVHDSRPHPNQVDYVNQVLIRDVSWGVGVAPEVIWMFSGETGPAIRFRMDELRRWTQIRQQRLERAAKRFWVYFWAKEFGLYQRTGGRLGFRMPNAVRWWACDWVPLADLTIDHGRDGNLELKRYEAGADTLTDMYRRRGSSAESALYRRAKEIALAEEAAETVLGDRKRWREVLPLGTGSAMDTAAAVADEQEQQQQGGRSDQTGSDRR